LLHSAKVGVELLHMAVPFHLGLVAVDTTISLTSERQEILVKELGCKPMTSVALRSLDVLVHLPLRLESLLATLVGTREWSFPCVIHHVEFEGLHASEAYRAASIGARITHSLSSVMPEDVPLENPCFSKCCTTVDLLTDEGAETKMNRIHMLFQTCSL